jgi:predicted RNA-binding Zn-ribbon protein involved in translation (DUF1610 family)
VIDRKENLASWIEECREKAKFSGHPNVLGECITLLCDELELALAENAELKGKTIAVSDTMIHGSHAEYRSCPRDGTEMIASRRRDGITYTCPGCGQKEVVFG